MKQSQFQKLTAKANDYDTCGDHMNAAECWFKARRAILKQEIHTTRELFQAITEECVRQAQLVIDDHLTGSLKKEKAQKIIKAITQ